MACGGGRVQFRRGLRSVAPAAFWRARRLALGAFARALGARRPFGSARDFARGKRRAEISGKAGRRRTACEAPPKKKNNGLRHKSMPISPNDDYCLRRENGLGSDLGAVPGGSDGFGRFDNNQGAGHSGAGFMGRASRLRRGGPRSVRGDRGGAAVPCHAIREVWAAPQNAGPRLGWGDSRAEFRFAKDWLASDISARDADQCSSRGWKPDYDDQRRKGTRSGWIWFDKSFDSYNCLWAIGRF